LYPACSDRGHARTFPLEAPILGRRSHDPEQRRVHERLQLTDAELALYRDSGVVSVDHGQRYSMGSAYYAIYTRDLPLLITSDSILHALHRSYDERRPRPGSCPTGTRADPGGSASEIVLLAKVRQG
jgi:hypothetical protein